MSNKPLFMLFDGHFNDDFCFQSFYKSGQSQNNLNLAHVADVVSGYYVVHVESVIEALKAKSKSIDVENKVCNLQDGEACVLYSTSRQSNLIAYRVSEQDIEFLNTVSDTF